MLVHDLDVRLVRLVDGEVFEPWILDPAQPALPATTGDNHRDNVEQIVVEGAARGNWQVVVSHKGELSAPQVYALLQTGLDRVAAPTPHAPRPVARFRSVGPNPSRGGFVLTLETERTVLASVSVYDLKGRLVRRLVNRPLAPGISSYQWDGRDEAGQDLAAGVYLLELESPGGATTRRVTLVR